MTTPQPGSDAIPPPGCPAHAGHREGVAGPAALRTAESLYGPEFAADPAAVYARLRTYGSIAPVEIAPGVHASLVTGYETALEVLRSPERFSKDPRRWRGLADGSSPRTAPSFR